MMWLRMRPLVLLLTLALGSSLPIWAESGSNVHYLVFELDAEGVATPLFHRIVELEHPLESLTEEQMTQALQSARGTAEPLAVRLDDSDGDTLFRYVLRVESWRRGEFHGAEREGGGHHIDATHIRLERRPFVVRVPNLPGAQLVLEGEKRSTFDLDTVARDASQLPLAQLGFQPQIGMLRGGGNPANRVDLLIMGDGYTSQADFNLDSANLADSFLNVSPYDDYANFVNVLTLFTVSPEAGADHPPYDPSCAGDDRTCCSDPTAINDPLAGTYVNTAFDGRYCAFNIHRLAVINTAAALAAASSVPDWDHILMLLNDGTYGGSGGFPPVTSIHPAAVDIARHEYGHSFTLLADEYDTPFPGFPACSDITAPPCEANVTDETIRSLIKWEPWIEPGTPIPTPEGGAHADDVGLFEGARYLAEGMYRPRDTDCLMHFLGVPFGEICGQSYILRLYQGGWGTPAGGIDPIEPGSEDPPPGPVVHEGPIVLSVDLLTPVGGTLDVSWWVDGVEQGVTGPTFEFDPPDAETYEIEIRVADPTPQVHPEMANGALNSQRTWQVTFSTDIFADGFESGDTTAWSMTTP